MSLRDGNRIRQWIALLGIGLGACSASPPSSSVIKSELRGSPTTIGIFRPQGSSAWWFLRNDNSPGNAALNFTYGAATGDTPVVGDWDGDGKTTVGVYRDQGPGTNKRWMLRNTNTDGTADLNFEYGGAGDLPVVGDWDGNGTVTIGVYRTYTNQFLLKNTNSPGNPDLTIALGVGDDVPVVGDWDGDGTTTVGVFHKATATWTLRNGVGPDIQVAYGGSTDIPIAGDWDGSGTTTIGVVEDWGDGNLHWRLRNSNTVGNPDLEISYGAVGDKPVAGAWQVPNLQPLGNAVTWTASPVSGSVGTFLADVTGPDADGKSRADLITADSSGISVLKSAGSAPLSSAQPWAPWDAPLRVLFGDVTGDHKADAIEIVSTGVWVRRSTGSGFGPVEGWLSANGSIAGTQNTFVVDVTGDGRADIVAVNTNGGGIKVWRARTDSTFNSTAEQWSIDAAGTVGTFIADVTGDGRADEVKIDTGSITVRRAPLTGNGPFGPAEAWLSTGFSGALQTLLVDVTGDGLADVVAVDGDRITMRRSDRWFFGSVETLSSTGRSASATVALADLTGDGRADYVETSTTAPVQVRVRQDRRIPIRFVQLVSTCGLVKDGDPHGPRTDQEVQAIIDNANVRYKDAGLSFYAQPIAWNPDCSGFSLSQVVNTPTLWDLKADPNVHAPAAEVEHLRATLNPACTLGTDIDFVGSEQLETVAARCGYSGEITIFVTALFNGTSYGNPAHDGKMIALDKWDGFDDPRNGRLAHEVGHYLGLPHVFDFGPGSVMDPTTGQSGGMSLFWDLVTNASGTAFFTSQAAAHATESALVRIQTDTVCGPEPCTTVPGAGWLCDPTHPCPPGVPLGTLGIAAAGSSTLAYTYKDPNMTQNPQLMTADMRLAGLAPHSYDGVPSAPGANFMSYGYVGTLNPDSSGWLSPSQIEVIQSNLANNVVTKRLDATGHVIFGDRPLLGTVGPKATISYTATGGIAKPTPKTVASNGGHTWAIGTGAFNQDGNAVYEWDPIARGWVPRSAGANQLALPTDGSNAPWAIVGPSNIVKQWDWNVSGFVPLANGPGVCSNGLAVGAHSSGTYAWSIDCGAPDPYGNRPLRRYSPANGWQFIAGPNELLGGAEIAVDWDGTPWVRTNRSGTITLYHAKLDPSTGMPTSWTEAPRPGGATVSQLSSGIGMQGWCRLPVNFLDSYTSRVYIYNAAGNSWSLADPLPPSVTQIAGALPYLYVVKGDNSILYAR